MQFKGLTVGVPREIMDDEHRVAVTPETVEKYVESGAEVLIESGAGAGIYIQDDAYSRKGAEILTDAAEVYSDSDIILKVKEPRFNEKLKQHEAELIKSDGILICFLHPAHSLNHNTVKMLADRGVASFTLDGIPRISRAQQMDALTSMSTAAGYKAVISAAYHLRRFVPMIPTAAGTIKPAEFVVVGTGVAGLQAVATAKRLGAKVKSLDIRKEANEQASSLGAEIINFEVPSDLAEDEDGYARRLSRDWYEEEHKILTPHLHECDAVILGALIPGEEAPILVTDEMVEGMREGSVLVDIAIDQGGNCALSRSGDEYWYENVLLCGLLNIPSKLSIDSTAMLARNIYSFLTHIVSEGNVRIESDDRIIEDTLVTKEGCIVHQGTLKAMDCIE